MQTTAIHRITAADFLEYGHRYKIDYHFPVDLRQAQKKAEQHIAQGRVEEFLLAPGVNLVLSDLEVMHPYISRSSGNAALLIIVVLNGRVRFGSGLKKRWLTAGEACNLYLDEKQTLDAYQPADQQLRTLSLALDECALQNWCNTKQYSEAQIIWSLPNTLRLPIKQAFRTPLAGQCRKLFFQGLALQLLAQGLTPPAQTLTVTKQCQRMEAVCHLLDRNLDQEYCLEDLATLAAMSPSTLVRRFRIAYGCTPTDYLRRRRLERARTMILNGYSIQHAAHLCGYRHASNFTTAFRRNFGISPGELAPSQTQKACKSLITNCTKRITYNTQKVE